MTVARVLKKSLRGKSYHCHCHPNIQSYSHVYSKRSCATHHHRDRCKQVRSVLPPLRDASTYSSAHISLRTCSGHSGIGFGICHRLLHNVLQNSTTPDDAGPVFPRSGAEGESQGIEYPCDGLTLIMACRSRQRAENARKKLLKMFEDDVAQFLLGSSGREAETERRRVEKFCENLVVEVHLLDLASVKSTLAFADEVTRT